MTNPGYFVATHDKFALIMPALWHMHVPIVEWRQRLYAAGLTQKVRYVPHKFEISNQGQPDATRQESR